MNVDFAKLGLPSVFNYNWSVTTHLYFTLGGNPCRVKSIDEIDFVDYPRHFIIGPRLNVDIVDLGMYRHVAGIAFRPGGLYRFLNTPLMELSKGLDLSLILAKQTRELSERLLNAISIKEVFTLLEYFLLDRMSQLQPGSAFDMSIAALVQQNGRPSVKQAADWAGLSMRHFERLCITRLGVPPKLYAKIIRFSNACLYKESYPQEKWGMIAHRFGYADQMHLIDDFKQFAGTTPTGLHKQMNLKLVTGLEARL